MANENELEEFLLRAAERRVAQNKRRPAQPPRATRPPVQADVVEDVELVHEGVAEHVERHMDSSAFDARAERLGDEVEMADDEMDQRVHEKFDHQLGDITEASSVSGRGPGELPPALSFLKDHDRLIQAIIASEILGRPDARW